MADMKGFTEKFRVQKVNASGDTERVTVQLGLDGLKLMNADGNRTMNSYDLSHVSRWSLRGNNLVLYTKTPVDVEERQITLRSDESTIRNVMDTLTCCCMQLSEILESTGKTSSDKETANSLHQLVRGNGKKKTSLPSVDEVEFWTDAEKSGYLQSQGEVLKQWRRRFFVLKQGYLFRFMDGNLSETSKPRGVVDLSKVTDVKDGKSSTGRQNSILLQTSNSSVAYIADTETEMVEWMSALETAMQHIVKHVAGVDDDSPRHSTTQNWMKQVQGSMGNSSSGYNSATVDVVAYDSGAGSATHTSSSSSYGGRSKFSTQPFSSGIDYSQVGGIAGVVGGGSNNNRNNTTTSHNNSNSNADGMDDLLLNYGGSSGGQSQSQRPTTTPSLYPQQPAAANYPPTSQYTSSYYPSYQQESSAPSYPSQTPSGGGYSTQTMSSAGYQTQSSSGYQTQQPSSGYQDQQQSSGYQMQSAAPSQSLIDQVPAHTPGYPYYQQPATANTYGFTAQAAPSSAPPASNIWQVLYTPDGKAYYHNTSTGSTQWEAPPGM